MDSNDVRRQWAERSGEYSPTYYAHYGQDETSDAILRLLDGSVRRDAPVLELGCSSGRHLAHLHECGFENPVGIELNEEAFEVMERTYPDLAAAGQFHATAIEEVIEKFETDHFGAVYSVETLQHLHPDAEWVFDELVRITDGLLVTVENEGDTDHTQPPDRAVTYVDDEFPLYYRDWNAVFTERGLTETEVASLKRDTVRAFRAE